MRQALFESLTGRFADGTPVADVPEAQRRLRSVLDHLERLLNTREGSLPHLSGYGLPDISDVYRRLPDAASELAAAIAATVSRYEPRLRRVSVTRSTTADRMRLVYVLSGELAGGGALRVQATFASSGQAAVAPWKRPE